MEKDRYFLEAAVVCHKGKIRENNEDNLYFKDRILEKEHEGLKVNSCKKPISTVKGCLLGVFDGMGGHAEGEMASYLMASEAKNSSKRVDKDQEHIATELKDICLRANEAVCEEMRNVNRRMGTTASMLFFYKKCVWSCNVGDSPIFRLRDGKLESIYEEHTEKGMFERMYGKEKTEGRKFHLTQHIGIFPEEMLIDPYIGMYEIRDKDMYLICSDGLTDMVEEHQICDILAEEETVESIVERLKETALEKGGRDNITIIIVRVAANKRNPFAWHLKN